MNVAAIITQRASREERRSIVLSGADGRGGADQYGPGVSWLDSVPLAIITRGGRDTTASAHCAFCSAAARLGDGPTAMSTTAGPCATSAVGPSMNSLPSATIGLPPGTTSFTLWKCDQRLHEIT